MTDKPKTQTYIARAPWVAGKRVGVGTEVPLTAEQAKYEPVAPKGAARAKPAPKPDAKSDTKTDTKSGAKDA